MPTRNVVLTDHQAALIERLVASGQYQDLSEVLRHGLRLVEQEEQRQAADLERIRAAVAVAEADMAAGRFVTIRTDEDLDTFMAGLEEGAPA